MVRLFSVKGSRQASFFIFMNVILCLSSFCAGLAHAQSSQSSRNAAKELDLAHDSIWMSLLHFSEGHTHIYDAGFILTSPHFSLSAELDATINAFYAQNAQENLCRFPARYFWLKQHIDLPDLSFTLCDGLQEFEEKAPADKISVVYVSENISQPSSMMGHLFLKISGLNSQSEPLEHAISFYTDAKTINIPKLIYDSMIKGKRGFFTLSPYTEKINSYVHDEQRNLWELALQLTEDQRQLIQLHLYELKQTEFKYFFQSYNCATVISFVVSLARPELREPEGVWGTPLDIAKKVNSLNEAQATHVYISNRWRIRMLQTQLPTTLLQELKYSVENKDAPLPISDLETQRFLSIDMALAYNNYRYENKSVSFSEWRGIDEKITRSNTDSEYTLDLSEYKNPLKTPPDSQLWIGVTNRNNEGYLRTGILPASHSLEDDNRQYFGETGLHLAAISLLTNIKTGSTKLEHFELYGAESIIPYDKFTGGLSGRFAIGVEPEYNRDMVLKQQAFIKGAVGYSYGLSADVDVYVVAGIGLGFTNNNKGFLFANPEAGVVVREVFDLKSIVSISQAYNYLGEANSLNELQFTQAKYFNNNYAAFFHAKKSMGNEKAVNSYDLTLKKYF